MQRKELERPTQGSWGCAVAGGIALIGAPVLLILYVVMPLRTLTHVELETPFERDSAALAVELLDEIGDVSHSQRMDPRGGSAFSYGRVSAVRVKRAGCKPRTFEVGGCTEEMHFTDIHRYLHHGSASHYERNCSIEVTLDCR